MRAIVKKLKGLNAYREAMNWVNKTPGELPELWAACEDPEWLYWLAGKAGIKRKVITLSACAIARSVSHLVPPGENRPRLVIEAAEGWAKGTVKLSDVRLAVNVRLEDTPYAAANAAADAAYAATNAATNAATYITYAIYAAHSAAHSAAYAAIVIADNLTFSAAYAASNKVLCSVVRRYITAAMIERGLK